jgi:hypothetical protein
LKTEKPISAPGIWTFTLIWSGQLVSVIGSGLTSFALGIWVYQRTGSATKFTLIALFTQLPNLVILPVAGSLVDKLNRRRTMMFCNLGSGFCTLILAGLAATGRLQIWHIYVIVIFLSASAQLLKLTFTTSVTLLVPKQHFGRSSGMMQAVQAAAQILPPLLAAALLSTIKLAGLISLDFASYVFATVTLLLVSIPQPEPSSEDSSARRSVFKYALYGWSYIRERSGLLVLLVYFASLNFIVGLSNVLVTPMILSFNTVKTLSTILSISGIGFLLGSICMSIWGGPRNRVMGLLGSGLLFGVCVFLVGWRPSPSLIATGMFGMFFILPILNGCSQAIWQTKTAPDVQGRVFAIRWMLALSTTPLAYLLAGPLAERVFEPLVAASGPFTWITGQGAGRGIALMFMISGIFIILVQLGSYSYPRFRHVERELPDAVNDGIALSKA